MTSRDIGFLTSLVFKNWGIGICTSSMCARVSGGCSEQKL